MSNERLARLEAEVGDLASRVRVLEGQTVMDLQKQMQLKISAIAGLLKVNALLRSQVEGLKQRVEQLERHSRANGGASRIGS
jgi:hypothetical protein